MLWWIACLAWDIECLVWTVIFECGGGYGEPKEISSPIFLVESVHVVAGHWRLVSLFRGGDGQYGGSKGWKYQSYVARGGQAWLQTRLLAGARYLTLSDDYPTFFGDEGCRLSATCVQALGIKYFILLYLSFLDTL